MMPRRLALFLVWSFFVFTLSARAENEDSESSKSTLTAEENLSISTKPSNMSDTRRRLTPKGESKLFSWWSPEAYRFSIGYEKGGSSVAALPQDNLTFGIWFSEAVGMDFLVGYQKAAGTTQEAVTVTETGTTTKSVSRVTRFSGETGASNFSFGTAIKFRAYQNSWFQFYLGALIGYGGASKTESTVGTRTELTADTSQPGTKTIQESQNLSAAGSPAGFATISTETKSTISIGPKLGTEFYIKWFPHLALGFATGILATFGGETVRTESVDNKTQSFINGVEQTNPTPSTPVVTTTSTRPGGSAGTFGIGGTQFSLTGIFTIRYVW